MTSIFRRRPDPDPAVGTAENGLPRESVWDYPRPPRIEPIERRVRVSFAGTLLVDTVDGLRVVETAGAPVVYVAPDDVAGDCLRPASGSSFCEWKGSAGYYDVLVGAEVATRAAWTYASPTAPFASIAGWVSFYPALVDCLLDEERVEPQPGGFYGGWVTAEICGPIKGEAGSAGW